MKSGLRSWVNIDMGFMKNLGNGRYEVAGSILHSDGNHNYQTISHGVIDLNNISKEEIINAIADPLPLPETQNPYFDNSPTAHLVERLWADRRDTPEFTAEPNATMASVVGKDELVLLYQDEDQPMYDEEAEIRKRDSERFFAGLLNGYAVSGPTGYPQVYKVENTDLVRYGYESDSQNGIRIVIDRWHYDDVQKSHDEAYDAETGGGVEASADYVLMEKLESIANHKAINASSPDFSDALDDFISQMTNPGMIYDFEEPTNIPVWDLVDHYICDIDEFPDAKETKSPVDEGSHRNPLPPGWEDMAAGNGIQDIVDKDYGD